ncbi:MAG: ABC transporter substrate-binding protein [Acidobacteria bacterium]|nr:ABC transporter substrate-binding protein [Acidobacteriota bacterium]
MDISDDAKTLTYTLRQGGTFHNGEPVNAAAFVRSFTRVAQKKTASEVAYHLSGIKGFDAAQEGTSDTLPGVHQGKDEYELVIELEQPNAEFFVRTGHLVFSPVPQVAVSDPKGFNEKPIGNGPYMLDGAWKHNVSVGVKKFAAYNGKVKGFLDSIKWKIYAEVEQAYLEFQAGTIEATDVPPEQFADAAAKYGAAFIDQASAILNYLLANNKNAPTNNKMVRQALSMAIDREAINKAVFNNQRVAAASIVPPVSRGHRAGACKYCTFNKDEAKRLLAESGVQITGPIELTFNSGAGHEEWIQAVAAQIKQNLGIEAVVKPGSTDFGDYIKSLDGLKGLGRLGWGQDYPTPDNWLYPLFYSTSPDNHSFYVSKEFDALIVKAQQTLDDAQRLALQQQAEDLVLEDMPVLPMFYGKSARVYSSSKVASFPVDIQYANPAWELVSLK